MYRCLKKISDHCAKTGSNIVADSLLHDLYKNEINKRAVCILVEGGYLKGFRPDGSREYIRLILKDASLRYFVERSEIWGNRVISFILGVLTGVVSAVIISIVV